MTNGSSLLLLMFTRPTRLIVTTTLCTIRTFVRWRLTSDPPKDGFASPPRVGPLADVANI